MEAQQSIHKLIAQQAPLQETLSAIAEAVSLGIPGVRVIVMRYDAATQTLSAMPNRLFSSSFMKCLQRLNVAKKMCTCGGAAHHRRLMVTNNIQTDLHWKMLRDAAVAEKLHTCWSSPVVSSDDELLGTVDAYFDLLTLHDVNDKINFQLYQASSLMT
ncbi:MAG: GAF domain-containing protein, partial [Halomonas sp.]